MSSLRRENGKIVGFTAILTNPDGQYLCCAHDYDDWNPLHASDLDLVQEERAKENLWRTFVREYCGEKGLVNVILYNSGSRAYGTYLRDLINLGYKVHVQRVELEE